MAVRVPRLHPFFPIDFFTPQSTCNHDRVPIPRGDRFCCMVCDRSGLDHLRALQRSQATDPRPERKPPAKPTDPKAGMNRSKTLTRRERRRLQFGGRE